MFNFFFGILRNSSKNLFLICSKFNFLSSIHLIVVSKWILVKFSFTIKLSNFLAFLNASFFFKLFQGNGPRWSAPSIIYFFFNLILVYKLLIFLLNSLGLKPVYPPNWFTWFEVHSIKTGYFFFFDVEKNCFNYIKIWSAKRR